MIDVEAPWILLNIDFVKAQNTITMKIDNAEPENHKIVSIGKQYRSYEWNTLLYKQSQLFPHLLF